MKRSELCGYLRAELGYWWTWFLLGAAEPGPGQAHALFFTAEAYDRRRWHPSRRTRDRRD